MNGATVAALQAAASVGAGLSPSRAADEGGAAPRLFNWFAAERGVDVAVGVPYGPEPRHKLDVYRPRNGAERPMVAVFFYGGSWQEGSRRLYPFIGTALAARGVTTIIPDYRLYPEVCFPEFMVDAALAYAWVEANIAKTVTAVRPVALLGHSAGAHIAALLALDPSYLDRHAGQASRPRAFIGLAGPYSFDPTAWPTTKAVFAPVAGDPDAARPVAFARANAPAALLLHGLADRIVAPANAHDMADALLRTGNAVHRIDYPGVGHMGLALSLARPFRWRAPVLTDILNFLEAQGV